MYVMGTYGYVKGNVRIDEGEGKIGKFVYISKGTHPHRLNF
jgi:hypothetical protein